MEEFILNVLIFTSVGAGMAAVPVVLSFVLWYNRKKEQSTKHKTQNETISFSKEFEPYESGMPPVGPARALGFEYLIYAILFLFFDVAAILAFLGVLVLRQSRSTFTWPLVIFFGLALFLAAYGLKKREYLRM